MYYIRRNIKKILIILLVIIIISLLGIKHILNSNKNNIPKSIEKEIKIDKKENDIEKKENKNKIFVDIKGAIKKPGVFEMDSDKKVIDVIYQAGGLSDEADTTYVNLAKKLTDEMVIIIYTKDQIKRAKQNELLSTQSNGTCVCPKISNDACINNNKSTNSTNNKSNSSKTNTPSNNEASESNKIVNINTASLEELQTITGIGESKAKAIIEYREAKGNFNTIEDIMNVSGIGESLYEKIKEYITV